MEPPNLRQATPDQGGDEDGDESMMGGGAQNDGDQDEITRCCGMCRNFSSGDPMAPSPKAGQPGKCDRYQYPCSADQVCDSFVPEQEEQPETFGEDDAHQIGERDRE